MEREMISLATTCEVPMPAPRIEAEIYRGIRDTLVRAHCAKKGQHECQGSVTLCARAITMRCKLCGDSRQTIVKD